MATIASLNIDLRANVAKFTKGMNKGIRKVKEFGASVAKVGKRLVRFGTVALAAATAGMGAFVASQFKAIDVLGKTAAKLGITTEELEKLRFAAGLSGVQISTFDMGLQRFERRLGEAAKGMGEAQGALKDLGIDAAAVAGRPVEAFKQVADAISQVQNPTERLRLAFKLFDSEGVALINVLQGGRAGLEAMSKEAEKFGTVLTGIEVAQIELANDALNKAFQAIVGIGRQIAVNLAPIVQA